MSHKYDILFTYNGGNLRTFSNFEPYEKQFWPKVLFTKFRTFQKFESSQIELLSGKSNFRGAKIFWPKFANRTFQRKINFWPKVLFPNFRTFQKCESSSIELLSEKPNFRGAKKLLFLKSSMCELSHFWKVRKFESSPIELLSENRTLNRTVFWTPKSAQFPPPE